MKKALSLILALVLCLSLSACSQTQSIETISMDNLFQDIENEAKAHQHIGKQTTAFGKITKIKTDYCVIEVMEPKDACLMVFMQTDVLAGFSIGQFVAISGRVSKVSNDGSYPFEMEGKIVENELTMDAFFLACLADTEASSGFSADKLISTYNVSFLSEYAASRGDAFVVRDDTELRNYLLGKWKCVKYHLDRKLVEQPEIKSDGTFFIEKPSRHSNDEFGYWDVSNGVLNGWLGDENQRNTVYVLSENVFIIENLAFVREN